MTSHKNKPLLSISIVGVFYFLFLNFLSSMIHFLTRYAIPSTMETNCSISVTVASEILVNVIHPIGKYSSSKSSSTCISCTPGTFQNQTGQSNCISCETGKFSNSTSVSFCYDCDKGSYASALGSSRIFLNLFRHYNKSIISI